MCVTAGILVVYLHCWEDQLQASPSSVWEADFLGASGQWFTICISKNRIINYNYVEKTKE